MGARSVEDYLADAAAFEAYLLEAVNEKYADAPLAMRDHVVHQFVSSPWNVEAMSRAYVTGGVFPLERLSKVVARTKDVRLQAYFLAEVDMGLYNRLYHDPINRDPRLSTSKRLKLLRMSLDQSTIGKCRVLWDRVLVLIYFLERGEDLPADGRRSRKGKFFAEIPLISRWAWLSVYQSLVADYDHDYRTPEFHSGSKLRKEIDGEAPPDPNALIEPLNAAMNSVARNVLAVVGGATSFTFDMRHMDLGSDIPRLDPRWRKWIEAMQGADSSEDGERPPFVTRK